MGKGLFKRIKEALTRKDEVLIETINTEPANLGKPFLTEGSLVTFPWIAETLRYMERDDPESTAIKDQFLDLIMSVGLFFDGPDKDLAEEYFPTEKLEEIAKELWLMGNAFIVPEKPVVLIPAELIAFKYENGQWTMLMFTQQGYQPVEQKVYHAKVSPMTVYPWGVPPSLSVINAIDLRNNLMEVLKAVLYLAKNPVYKITVKDITLVKRIKSIFTQWKEGGINFVTAPEGVMDIEALDPPKINIEKFIEAIDKWTFSRGLTPDLQFFMNANKTASETMLQIVSMRAKRIIMAMESTINKILRDLGVDAKLNHGYYPYEQPTMDIQSIALLADMGIIAPHEVRVILNKLGLLPDWAINSDSEQEVDQLPESWDDLLRP